MSLESRSAGGTEKGAKKKNQDRYVILDLKSSKVVHGRATMNQREENNEEKEKQGKEGKEKDEEEEEDETLMAMFDGHGDKGEEVAEYLTTRLIHYATTSSSAAAAAAAAAAANDEGIPPAPFSDLRAQLRTDPTAVLNQLFERMAVDLAQESGIDCYISGSTACIAHLWGSKLTVANLGDTRAVLASFPEGAATPDKSKTARANVITTDHTCEIQTEKQRILDAGGRVDPLFENGQPIGPLRVFKGTLPYPGLVVTRSFGDDVAHRVGVSTVPEITPIELIPEDLFIIIATDGLWDIVSPKQAVKFLQKYPEVSVGCQALVAHTLGLSDGDNITILVYYFRKGARLPNLGSLKVAEEEQPAEPKKGSEENQGEEEEEAKPQPRPPKRGQTSESAARENDEMWSPGSSTRLSMIVSEFEEDDRDQWAGR